MSYERIYFEILSSDTINNTMPYRHRKTFKTKIQKSHRLIEKRRRDRMNNSLEYLLQLVPHQKPDVNSNKVHFCLFVCFMIEFRTNDVLKKLKLSKWQLNISKISDRQLEKLVINCVLMKIFNFFSYSS